jgi:uncharacterized protein Yka (UPF0111/DUF47 family)
MRQELAAAGVQDAWLRDLPASASLAGDAFFVPDLPALSGLLNEDLGVMARPVVETADLAGDDHAIAERLAHWHAFLTELKGDHLGAPALHALTHGNRHEDDSLHILVMDLHKRINQLAAGLASEDIDGAHVWQVSDTDRPLIRAFMAGLNRTAPLKLSHPGLDTAATRDGERLLIQNDIGTNDAHVLVLQVQGLGITLTYSDLHRGRFAFFQQLLAELGAHWSVVEPRVSEGLNQGEAYWVGTATFACADTAALCAALGGVGARIVFLIDWNRARKRLQHFVDKDEAVAVLTELAHREIGHMAWLQAGGERLVFDAMQALGEETFRIGDRLEAVLGKPTACALLVDVMAHATRALLAGQPVQLVADETRMLMSHYVQRRGSGFELLSEHAAYCQTLAQRVRDGLAHGLHRSQADADQLAARAKAWERRADHLVMQARERAVRQPHWHAFARILELADDVADALEEAAFMLSLIADGHHKGWHADVQHALQQLADTVLDANQAHVKALAVAVTLGMGHTPHDHVPDGQAPNESNDHDAFLTASWNVMQAERRCDELLRQARRVILRHIDDAASLMLANDLAMTLELASDRLLVTGYAVRDLVLQHREDHP